MKQLEKKVQPVNVNNDAEMVALGIRNPNLKPRDPSVWSKTEKERKLWKKYRRYPAPGGNWVGTPKNSRFSGKFLVQVKGMDKTTYSHKCLESDMPYILSKYKTDYSTIIKAFWNGKEITPDYILKQAV